MLDLSSDRWKHLDHAYGPADDIPALIEQLKTAPPRERGDWQAQPWHSLWSALAHQSDVYTASFAAVPHLVVLAGSRPPRERIDFLELVAWIEICRHSSRAPLIPGDLQDAYAAALAQAAELVLECLSLEWAGSDYRALLGGLAALRGEPELGASIIDPPEEFECPECRALVPVPRHELFQQPGAP